jgi:heterodisulfide reductase subunit A
LKQLRLVATVNRVTIGVFICTCGDTIQSCIDTGALATFAKKLPDVRVVETRANWCQADGIAALVQAVKSQKLDRIVMAGCSPQFLGPRIEQAVASAGLTRGQVAYANIREHCAWVHPDDPAGATAKAKRLLRAAVFRVAKQSPIAVREYPVAHEVLVLGAGVAGIQASLDLASRRTPVHLVERAPCIGGHMALLVKAFPRACHTCGDCIEAPRMVDAATTPSITLYPYTELAECRPSGRNFLVTLRRRTTHVDWDKCTTCLACVEKCPVKVADEWSWGLSSRKAIYRPTADSVPNKVTIDADHCLKLTKGTCGVCAEVCPTAAVDFSMKDDLVRLTVGSIVLATGFEEFNPSVIPELMYGRNPDVVTQMQLTRMLAETGPTRGKLVRPSDGQKPARVVMIQCVGARDNRFDWQCHSYCCMAAIEHAALIKQVQGSDVDITILCRDVRAAGKGFEEYFVRTRDQLGVKFVYRGDEVAVTQRQGKTFVDFADPEGQRSSLPADLVVLSCAMTPSKGTEDLAKQLGVPLDEHGFFQALDEKIALARTTIPGVYVCGVCHSPKLILESVGQASAAAQEAAIWLSTQVTQKEMDVATVNEDLCNGCGLCLPTCVYHAISLDAKTRRATVDAVRCQVCGQCFSICPVGAIAPLNENQAVLDAAVQGLLGNAVEGPTPVIVGYACQECCYRTIDEAGDQRLKYPSNLHVVEVPCTGSVSIAQILRTLKAGAGGVVLYACDPQLCHYGRGAKMANSRATIVRSLLAASGSSPDCVQVVHMFGREAQDFVNATRKAVATITGTAKGG